MGDIAKFVGQQIRCYRKQRGLSQEKLSELSGCHPTYIGQLERGEKNATLESVEKIAVALHIPLARLVERPGEESGEGIPLKCYQLLATKTVAEQEQLYRILLEVERYKGR